MKPYFLNVCLAALSTHPASHFNTADQSKIFISLNLLYLKNLLPLLVSIVCSLFKILEKTSSSQASLYHSIFFLRILELFFIASWILLKSKTVGFIAFQRLDLPFFHISFQPDCLISCYFTTLLPAEGLSHPVTHVTSSIWIPLHHSLHSHIFKNLQSDGFHSKLAYSWFFPNST